MIVLGWTLLVLGAVGALAQTGPPLDWWQTTVFYQIYPRSFKDSNGDGTGDLNGITEKLDHLKDLGVGAIWISPIYTSPLADFGYDVADFKNVDPIFGNLDDFDKLIEKAKRLDVKVVLDFVPNHSSDENEWFIKSAANESDYRDYYVWRDPKGFDASGNPIPPNNWLSVFKGSAWEYNEQRKQFYFHEFYPKQPDLNYRSPKLVQEMKDVLTFWLDRGVSGFRVDAVTYLYEDPRDLDEPLSNSTGVLPDNPDYLTHIYTQNLPETYDMIEQWRELLDEYSKKDNITRVMMTEAYASLQDTMRYYGTEERRGAHFTFNFNFVGGLNADSNARDFSEKIDVWLDNMPKWAWANWVIGNHDTHRVASRYSVDMADCLNMLTMILPGTTVSYYGEEIVMVNANISYEDTQDPLGCNAGPDRYESISRDPERTPFQWDDTVNAGFSMANKTWLPVNPNYLELNLEAQKLVTRSHYNVYKRLVQARALPVVQYGKFNKYVMGDMLVIHRETAEGLSLIVAINFAEDNMIINLNWYIENLPTMLQVYAASLSSLITAGASVLSNRVPVIAKAGLVLVDPELIPSGY